MIKLTKLNNETLIVNVDLIEFVEATPDTIVTTTTGRKIMVRETVDEVITRITRCKQLLQQTTKAALTVAAPGESLPRRAPSAAEGALYG